MRLAMFQSCLGSGARAYKGSRGNKQHRHTEKGRAVLRTVKRLFLSWAHIAVLVYLL